MVIITMYLFSQVYIHVYTQVYIHIYIYILTLVQSLQLLPRSLKILHFLILKYKESNLQDEPPYSHVTACTLQMGSFTCTWDVSPCTGEVEAQFTTRYNGQYTFLMSSMKLTFIKYGRTLKF